MPANPFHVAQEPQHKTWCSELMEKKVGGYTWIHWHKKGAFEQDPGYTDTKTNNWWITPRAI